MGRDKEREIDRDRERERERKRERARERIFRSKQNQERKKRKYNTWRERRQRYVTRGVLFHQVEGGVCKLLRTALPRIYDFPCALSYASRASYDI